MKTYQRVYEKLSQAQDFVTGESLAQDLGLSRTAIWKAVQTLQENGLTISSVRKKGYLLEKGDLLLADTIAEELQIPVHFNPDSISTQMDTRHGLEIGHQAPALYLAPNQGDAKGRFNRSFFTSPNGGIYMSLHLKPNCSFQDLPPYTMMVAAAIVRAIHRLTGIETEIKWVNDIYLGSKKIAGILTEAITSVESGHITDVIIGVGLNFSLDNFPNDLADKVTSLFTNHPPTITRSQLISEMWHLFFTIPTSDLIKVYKEKSLVLNRQVTFTQAGITYKGLAKDISDKGALLIILENGQERWLTAGEVSLTSW